MSAAVSTIDSPQRVAAHFLVQYYNIWDKYFPGLNKRAHWHVIFMARTCDSLGISSRAIHRTLYGSYGTDIRTCIERIKDCERSGVIQVFDATRRPCVANAACLIGPTERLLQSFDAHCRDALDEVRVAAGGEVHRNGVDIERNDRVIWEIYHFFGACDRKWRDICEAVIKKRGLTPAHVEDAMDHLVTYQYWAIIMLLWVANACRDQGTAPVALVVDEIISRMWDRLRLGHLAIRERVTNLIRWGFFAEETIKKHKAVSLLGMADDAISAGLAEMQPYLLGLHKRLCADHPG